MASNSNPSSEVSIEEIGSEEVLGAKDEDAEEIVTDDSKPPREDEAKEESQSVAVAAAAPPPGRIEELLDNDAISDDDDYDDFEDETLYERLVGLTEMFPESLRRLAHSAAGGGVSGARWLYSAARTAVWIVASTAVVTVLPAMVENERLGMEEATKMQQRQILLGPGAAVSGGGAAAAGQQNAPLPPPAM